MKRKFSLMGIVILMLITTLGTSIVYADTVRFVGTVGAIYRVYIEEGTEVTVEFNCLYEGLIDQLPGIPGINGGNPIPLGDVTGLTAVLPLPIAPNNQLDYTTILGGDIGLDACGLSGYYVFIAPMTGTYEFWVIEAGFGHYELIIHGANIRRVDDDDPWIPDARLNPDMAAEVAVYALDEILQVYGLNETGLSYLTLSIPFSEIVCEPAAAQTAPAITNQAGTIQATCLSTGEIQINVTEGATGTLNFSPGDLTCNSAPSHTQLAASANGKTRLYCLATGELQLNIDKGHEELVYVWNQMPPTLQTTYVYNKATGEQLSYNTQEIGQ